MKSSLKTPPSTPQYLAALPFWPSTCALFAALVLNGLVLGVFFGQCAVIPLSGRWTLVTCVGLLVSVFSIFRYFRLSNFVIYTVGSLLVAFIVFTSGHLYAFYRGSALTQSTSPTNFIAYVLLIWNTFSLEPLIKYFWSLFYWLLQALTLFLSGCVAPFMVCIMFAEED